MSRDEALKILGLDSEVSEDEINKAYQKLMKLIHPDKGGSEYFAQKLNAARDKLLKK
ncbi:DnaJ domain-containing protein [Wolbachia endosymbiont of Ctenocephalides felis wCfeT]|uniref:DnaJ domain-containing protein n=1 Tax=Wolbachia endosymbiont of Ctenocephalides felis wCfeT TaxID=2732593 RepID=UPI001FEB481A|nr:DnaJ domain-containing protein [Wolbachia endosymbiont of Ctenocephalides felis wCfeT]